MNQSPKSVAAVDTIVGGSQKCTRETQRMAAATASNSNDDDGDTTTTGIDHARSLVFELAALVGELSSLFLTRVPLDPPFQKLPSMASEDSSDNATNSNNTTNNKTTASETKQEEFSISRPTAITVIEDEDVARAMGRILLKLLQLSHTLDLKLVAAIRNKMALNNKKYPASLCRGKSGKYTQYSSVTGITKDEGQSTLHIAAATDDDDEKKETVESFLASLELLTADIGRFATARQWSLYHKPRNLLLALLGELGELSELFQWRGDHDKIDSSISKADMDKLGQELADVTIYLIRLSDVSHINLKAQAEALLIAD